MKFGRWEVKSDKKIINYHLYYKCVCECGTERFVRWYCLKNGVSKSCGCLASELTIKRSEKHSMYYTRFYKIWSSMKTRTTGSNKKSKVFQRYHRNGIGIVKYWHNFEIFKKDMYKSYLEHVSRFGEKETTIDRIDNKLGYTPENCRWATYKEQNLNRGLYNK